MKRWQEIAVSKVLKVNFIEEENIIKEAFATLCAPIVSNDGIEFDSENSILSVASDTYKLKIEESSISIVYSNNIRGELSYSYLINPNNEYAYLQTNPSSRGLTNFYPLESNSFDYEEIIDTIMDNIIK